MSHRPTVFLSYRRQPSADLARYIRDRLIRMNVDVFFDVENLNGGVFPEKIRDEIITRQYFLIILAPTTLDSDWVKREVQLAFKHYKKIIPLETNEFDFSRDIPPELSDLKQYGGIPYDFRAPEQAFKRLADGLGISYQPDDVSQSRPSWLMIASVVALALTVGVFILRPISTPQVILTETPSTSIIESSITPSSMSVSSTLVKSVTETPGYPCEGTVIVNTGPGVRLNVVKTTPQKKGSSRPSFEEGSIVTLLEKLRSDGEDWYLISYTSGVNNGWIPSYFVSEAFNCPNE